MGFKKTFAKIDEKLTTDFITEKLGFDLDKINPETEFFHPVKQMEKIYHLIEQNYDK